MNSRYFLGAIALLVFLLGDGARMVYAAYFMYVEFSPFVLVLCFSALSLLLSSIAYMKTDRAVTSPDSNVSSRKILFYSLINLFTFTSWTAGYYAISYMVPAAFSAIAVSVGPILLALVLFNRLGVWNLVLSVFALTTAFLLSTTDLSAIRATGTDADLLHGVLLSVVCGVSIFINTILSKALNSLNESPLKINALRVPLVFVMSIVACYKLALFDVLREHLLQLLVFTFFFMFVTQVFLQYSIKWLGASFVTVGISSAPIFAVFVQLLFFDQPIDRLLVYIIVLNGAVLIAMAAMQVLRKPAL